MADYAIGLSFHKAHRTVVRAVALNSPCRYFATRDNAGIITAPTLDAGDAYVEIQGVTQANFQINDNNQEFRLLGDDGWNDSVITGAGVQASCTAYFLRDAEIPAGAECPQFRGNYDEGFALIQRARYDKDYEIYIEFLKEMGRSNGDTGDFIYDFTGFNCCIMNYAENMSAEGLTEITFDLVSRGRPVFGRLNNGPLAIDFGDVQSTILWVTTPLDTTQGTRRVAFDPANNETGHAVGDSITCTYTSDGSTALTQLELPDEGDGFGLYNSATGARISCAVSISANVVTINPDTNLAAGTIFDVIAVDGAVTQSVNAQGVATANATARPFEGFKFSFRTA
jgi:hypothetical protein